MPFDYQFEWVGELPGKSHQSTRWFRWADRLEPLMQRPGKWAKLGTGDGNTVYAQVSNLRNGQYTMPEGHENDFEFAARTIDGEKYAFARYVGPPINGVTPTEEEQERVDEEEDDYDDLPDAGTVADAWAL